MHAGVAIQMMSHMFWTGLLICLPVLLLTMLIGVVIGILQVVTQIQEMTLTFVPKLITAAVTLVVLGPWMLNKLTQFCTQLWLSIPSMF